MSDALIEESVNSISTVDSPVSMFALIASQYSYWWSWMINLTGSYANTGFYLESGSVCQRRPTPVTVWKGMNWSSSWWNTQPRIGICKLLCFVQSSSSTTKSDAYCGRAPNVGHAHPDPMRNMPDSSARSRVIMLWANRSSSTEYRTSPLSRFRKSQKHF